jgi:hypothetical protein
LPERVAWSTSGLLSGTSKKAGSYPVSSEASNAAGLAAETVTITVS